MQYFIITYADCKTNTFQLYSLKAESRFEKTIRDDIIKHEGYKSPWQSSRLESIKEQYDLVESNYDAVKNNKDKLPTVEQRFIMTDNKRLYDIAYRDKSHDVHGDWVYIARNFLSYDNESNIFTLNLDDYGVDIRQLNPLLLVCYETLNKFIKEFQGHGIPQDLCDELSKDIQIICLFDNMHQNYICKRDVLFETDSSISKYVLSCPFVYNTQKGAPHDYPNRCRRLSRR